MLISITATTTPSITATTTPSAAAVTSATTCRRIIASCRSKVAMLFWVALALAQSVGVLRRVHHHTSITSA
eukprot:2099040-Pleurochrysis_carterae.AAC.1